jgi:hypothetical protein
VAVADIDIGLGSGTFEATLLDPAGNPAGPTNVIQVSDPWSVRCRYQVSGVIALFSGTWRVQVALEGIGGTAAETVKTVLTPMVAGQVTPYTTDVNFAPNEINLGGEDSVTLHTVALLTARTSANAPLPIASMVDLGTVQIYRFS